MHSGYINEIKFPYDSGLWVKCIDLSKIDFKFYTNKEHIFVKSILERNFDFVSVEHINTFLKIIVDKELLIYLPEEIMIFDVFKNIFEKVNKEEAQKIFLDLEGLSVEEHDNAESYEKIREIIFNQKSNNSKFFSNCQPYNNLDISQEEYYYKELNQYPCCVALSGNIFIIYWSNL